LTPARLILAGTAALMPAVIWRLTPGLSDDGRVVLIILVLSVAGWTLSRLGDSTVALLAGLALVLAGAATPTMLYATLGSDLIWLLVAAFVIAAAVKASGLAEAAILPLARRARSVGALFHGLAGLIALTALVVPSTSGRAALMLPVFLALADALPTDRMRRALALLFPTAILLSASGSLIGAGAHLVAVDAIARLGGPKLGYLDWLMVMGPFAVVTTHAATQILLWTTLDRSERSRPLASSIVSPDAGTTAGTAIDAGQRRLLMILAVIVAGWILEPWHGLGLAFVALVGAVAATWPGLGPVKLKAAMKSVEWDLLIFMALTLLLGQALIASDADEWLARHLLAGIGAANGFGRPVVVLLIGLIALAAHLVITSRTARAMVLIPSLAVPLAALGFDPTTLVLVIVAGTGFCQTLPASAKPVALYAGLDRPTYAPSDLATLALRLAPMMVVALGGLVLLRGA
jgi:di/tricarboxylate transporter